MTSTTLILLSTLCLQLTLQAIILNQPFYTLTRVYQYRLTILTPDTQTSPQLISYFNLATTKNGCDAEICLHGWISNYTLKGKFVSGYENNKLANNGLFMVQVLKNGSSIVTRNDNVDEETLSLLQVTQKMVFVPYLALNLAVVGNSPSTAVNSNFFHSSAEIKGNKMFLDQINKLSYVNSTDLLNRTQATDSWISWQYGQLSNQTISEFQDVLVIDKTSKYIKERQFFLKQQKSIITKLQLIDNSTFLQLSNYQHYSQQIVISGSSSYLGDTISTEIVEELKASLFKLLI